MIDRKKAMANLGIEKFYAFFLTNTESRLKMTFRKPEEIKKHFNYTLTFNGRHLEDKK